MVKHLLALDIETACGLSPPCEKECSHALQPERSLITVVGVWDERGGRVFRSLALLDSFLRSINNLCLVGHNIKFDLRHLKKKGFDFYQYTWEDTMLMAHTHSAKVNDEWLVGYEEKRVYENKLCNKAVHRKAGPLSLKTLAPFFMDVPPFWETANHDNDSYVLKDCEYTFWLYKHFDKILTLHERHFYENKLKPWTRLLAKMEDRGITLDTKLMGEMKAASLKKSDEAESALNELWKPVRKAWAEKQIKELRSNYYGKYKAQVNKGKKVKRKKYLELYRKALQKIELFSIDSSSQLMWALRDFLGYAVTNFEGEETTGKEVLNELSVEHADVALLSTYRKERKLATAFFPSYEALHKWGVIHPSFNAAGTKTGRLSCSQPNLQQVASSIHSLFIARDGHKLCTYDMSAIEPRLIAHYTQDPVLLGLLASGADFHGYNAKIFFDLACETHEVKEAFPQERRMAKEVGLSLFYGAGPNRILGTSMKYGLNWDEAKCKEVYAKFKKAYKKVFTYRDTIVNPMLQSGHSFRNYLGRPVSISNPDDVQMQGFNRLIQGSASDMVWNAAYMSLEDFNTMGIDAHPLLLVHDEIVFEVADPDVEEALKVIKQNMCGYKLNGVTLTIEGKVDTKWSK